LQPRGRPLKGKHWDSVTGKWVSDGLDVEGLLTPQGTHKLYPVTVGPETKFVQDVPTPKGTWEMSAHNQRVQRKRCATRAAMKQSREKERHYNRTKKQRALQAEGTLARAAGRGAAAMYNEVFLCQEFERNLKHVNAGVGHISTVGRGKRVAAAQMAMQQDASIQLAASLLQVPIVP
jgi:hypothetical protein